jgi:hypothetical protein
MSRLDRIAEELRTAVRDLDPATLMPREAARLTKVAAEGERLFAAAKVLLARRAVDGNGWRGCTDAMSPSSGTRGSLDAPRAKQGARSR